jgi:nucleotide-binding universal stress UspA family protein
MGSQGATGLQEMFIGSNTEKVVRRSHVPVLVVKTDMDEFKVKDMVYATDFRDDSKKEFQKIIDFAELFNSKIHFLYVNTIHNFNTTKAITERMNDFIADFKIKDFTTKIYNDISVENGILNYTEEIGADLIAMNTHGRSGLARLFSGSVGTEMTNHAIKPVITFKI